MQLLGDSKFSRQLKKDISGQVVSANLELRRQQLHSNIRSLREQSQPEEASSMLLANILADHLRSLNLNYSYSVFLREANIKSEQVVLREDLLAVTNLHQCSKLSRLDFDAGKSVLQIMMECVGRWQVPVTSSATQTIEAPEQRLPNSYYDSKIGELKAQLQSIAAAEKDAALNQLTAQMKQKMYEQIRGEFEETAGRKQAEYERMLAAQEERLLKRESLVADKHQQQTKSLSEELKLSEEQSVRLKQELKEALKKVQKHRCTESEQYMQALTALKDQTKRLKEKEEQYKLALANINTTVEDIVAKKEALLMNDKKDHELRLNKLSRSKGMDDQAAKALLTAISNMEGRIKDLSAQNDRLREELDSRSRKVFQLDRQLSSIQQDYANSHLSIQPSGIRNYQRATKSIGIFVHEGMLNEKAEKKSEESEQQQRQQQIQRDQLIEYIEQANKKKLMANKNIEELKMDMGRIRRRVRHLIEEPL